MAKRFFKEHASGDSEWTPEARKMLEEASEVVRIFLDEEEPLQKKTYRISKL